MRTTWRTRIQSAASNMMYIVRNAQTQARKRAGEQTRRRRPPQGGTSAPPPAAARVTGAAQALLKPSLSPALSAHSRDIQRSLAMLQFPEQTFERLERFEKLHFEPLGLRFRSKHFLLRAFVHRSFVGQLGEKSRDPRLLECSNQPLATVGDGVLHFVAVWHAFTTSRVFDAWALSLVKSRFVKNYALHLAARSRFRVMDYVILGDENLRSLAPGRDPSSLPPGGEDGRAKTVRAIEADIMEALVGATYFDQGLEAAAHFVCEALFPAIDNAANEKAGPWSPLKEIMYVAAVQNIPKPSVDVKQTSAPGDPPQYVGVVSAGGRVLGTAEGASENQAKTLAAVDALSRLRDGGKSHV